MIFIRSIIFTVTLAFGFILSGNLDGIGKIREGAADMAESVIAAFQNRESTVSTDVGREPSVIGTYVTQTNAKYLLIAIVLICGFFGASIVSAGVLGLLSGVLFSPEIASVPFLAQAAVTISDTVSALWADLIAKIAELSR